MQEMMSIVYHYWDGQKGWEIFQTAFRHDWNSQNTSEEGSQLTQEMYRWIYTSFNKTHSATDS